MTEHVLDYVHQNVIDIQSTTYWCGPAATGIVLSTFGIQPGQPKLASQLDTTVDGTADIVKVTPVLNSYVQGADYSDAHMPNDPPTDVDRQNLWSAIKRSIDNGCGLVFNIEVPPSNYPIGVKGSQTPNYSGGTVYHYIAGMGYDDDSAFPAVFIADPGFSPFSYWVAFSQLATMIPPKGYTGATALPNVLEVPVTQPLNNQQKLDFIYDKLSAYAESGDISGATQGGKWLSRARYAPNPSMGVDDTVGIELWTDANVFDHMTEWAASQGYNPARQLIAARAQAHPEDSRAVFFAQQYPPL